MLGDLTTTTESIDTQQLSQALDVVAGTLDDAAPEIEAAFDGIARLSQSVASRDEQIQTLFESSSEVTKVLEARSEDIVDLMGNSDLVFQELQKRKRAVHTTCWSTPDRSPIELEGVAKDNEEQIGPALQEVDELLDLLVDKRDQLKATLHQLGPYVEILSNIIGTGPWFDAMAINLTTLPVELRPGVPEFVPGFPERSDGDDQLPEGPRAPRGAARRRAARARRRSSPSRSRRRRPRRSPRTSRARSASTRAPRCGSSASRSAR